MQGSKLELLQEHARADMAVESRIRRWVAELRDTAWHKEQLSSALDVWVVQVTLAVPDHKGTEQEVLHWVVEPYSCKHQVEGLCSCKHHSGVVDSCDLEQHPC